MYEYSVNDKAEIIFLSTVGTIAMILNTIVFVRLLRQSRTPTARTSFMTGPYHLSSFTLFKLNLCITDFLILLIHSYARIIWLLTYSWPFGDTACRAYQFFNILSFYSNSNVIVAIGVDRLKVVYTSHIQGAASVRRVRIMLSFAWIIATLCSVPQLFLFQSYNVNETFIQCSSIFKINTSFPSNWTDESINTIALSYEMFTQATVAWIPFIILAISYLLIALKLLHFTFRPVHCTHIPKSSNSISSTTRLLNLIEAKRPESLPYQNLLRDSIALDTIPRSSSFIEGIMNGKNRNKKNGLKTNIVCTLNPDIKGIPLWRKQLRSRVFLTALIVVIAHVAIWLPYVVYSTIGVVNPDLQDRMKNFEIIFEDLIVVNSLINPLLYSYPCTL